jgi:hypothetical protein
LIQNWVEIIGVLILVLAALIGAFWKLVKISVDNKSKYEQDIKATRSLVISRDVIPEIISLIEKVEVEKGLRPGQSLEEVLSPSQSSFAHSLRRVIQPMSPINELEGLYLRAIDCAFKCAYDMLILAIVPGITILWVFIDLHWEYFIPLILLFGGVILIKAVFDILIYTRTLRRFIEKDNEIRLQRSVS